MNMLRTALLFAGCLTIAGNAGAQGAVGSGYRILVGYPPGGGTDSVSRHVALGMAQTLGEPVIVENRPGSVIPL